MTVDETALSVEGLAGLCEARESIISNGPAAGCRQIELRAYDGIDLRILPDRGFDIAQAWWRGRPLAWTDQSREAPPTPHLRGRDWIRGFTGGLLTTCGLRHVGHPRDGHGLHGRISHQRAHVRAVGLATEDGAPTAAANAIVAEPGEFGALLEVDRTVTTWPGVGRLRVRDLVTNRGAVREPLKLLYHLNFTCRDGRLPQLAIGAKPVPEDVLARAADTVALPVPPKDTATAELRIEHRRAVARVEWRTDALTHLYLWSWPTRQGDVLAIEPSTASFDDRPGSASQAPRLAPGERLELGFTLTVRDLDGAEG